MAEDILDDPSVEPIPDPVVEPTPEPQPQPSPEPTPQPEPQKMVPHQALHEARMEIREMRERLQFVDQLKAELLRMKSEQSQPKPPAFEEDPLANLNQRIAQAEAYNRQIQEQQQRVYAMQQEAAKNEQASQQIINATLQHEAEFKKTHADYGDAIQFLAAKRGKELEYAGVVDPMARQQYMTEQAWNFSVAALRAGKNPAEQIYNLAKEWGYQPKTPGTDLTAVQAGIQQASARLTGASPESNPSMDALLKAEGDEFEQMWNTIFKVKK